MSNWQYPATEEEESDWDGSDWEWEDDEYEDYGSCSVCGHEYAVYDNTDHCADEGRCWEHCTDPISHNPQYDDILNRAVEEVQDGA